MPPEAPDHLLTSYFSESQLRTLAARDRLGAPFGEHVPGAAVVVDISGFTQLTERFAEKGEIGAEHLLGILHKYFDRVIRIITDHAGDVVSLAGDAALAIWTSATREGLSAATCLAAKSGLAIQHELRDYAPLPDVTLRQRVGIGAGDLVMMEVGGLDGRWVFLLAGDPIRQAARGQIEAGPGEVALSLEAYQLVRDSCSGTSLPSGNFRLGAVLSADSPPCDEVAETRELSPLVLRTCLPQVVIDRLDAGQSEWIAEFRHLTVIFAGLHGLDCERFNALPRVQRAVESTQRVLRDQEGFLYQFLMDDKGLTIVAAFGLPSMAHENDAERAVEAAIMVRRDLDGLGISASIGIATGRTFCGVYGSSTRRQYAAVGRSVNLSARLMQSADSGEILCDEGTVRSIKPASGLEFESLDPIDAKGWIEPVPVYRPRIDRTQVESADEKAGVQAYAKLAGTLIGRANERAALERALAALRESKSQLVVIEGEAGIGKSRLVEHLLDRAREQGLRWLRGAGDAIDTSTPYHAWRAVFRRLLWPLGLPESVATRREQVLAMLKGDEQALALVPLLNGLIPVEFVENDVTVRMSGEIRAKNLEGVLLQLLQAFAFSPAVVALDDAQWLDSASRALVILASRQVSQLLMVISKRPLTEPDPGEYGAMIAAKTTLHLRLEAMSADEASELVCQRLGVRSLSPALGALIYQKAAGHPLFTEEFGYALRDAGLIRIAGDRIKLATDEPSTKPLAERSAINLPSTVQDIVTSRIDRLTPSHQLTVKAASVIGLTFPLEILREVHPIGKQSQQLMSDLAQLVNSDFIVPIDANHQTYSFRHTIIQEVVYNAIPFSHRRVLHMNIAKWYERVHQGQLSPFYSILAHHYRNADVPSKAVQYLGAAGEQALGSFANEEAVRFLTEAINIDQQQLGCPSPNQTALWELELGKAFVNWSKYAEGQFHLEQGLKFRGNPVAKSPARALAGLLKEALIQIVHRIWPRHFTGRRRTRRKDLLQSAQAYEALMEIYYLKGKSVHCLQNAVRALNLAELAGASPELARCYASVGAILGFARMHGAAEAYCQRGLTIARKLDDLTAQAWVSLTMGTYKCGFGRWAEAFEMLSKTKEISICLGDRRRWDDSMVHLSAIAYLQGQFAESLRMAEGLYESAAGRHDSRGQGLALRRMAQVSLLHNERDELATRLAELESLRWSEDATFEQFFVCALRAQLQFRRAEYLAAAASLTRAAQLMARTTPSFYEILVDYALVGDACFELCEKDESESSQGSPRPLGSPEAISEIRVLARRVCKCLSSYSRVFPIGKPATYINTGRYYRLTDKPNRALEAWQESLEAARRFGMPHNEALAHYEIGRHLPADHAERDAHLLRAQDIFTRLGATYDTNRVKEARRLLRSQHRPL